MPKLRGAKKAAFVKRMLAGRKKAGMKGKRKKSTGKKRKFNYNRRAPLRGVARQMQEYAYNNKYPGAMPPHGYNGTPSAHPMAALPPPLPSPPPLQLPPLPKAKRGRRKSPGGQMLVNPAMFQGLPPPLPYGTQAGPAGSASIFAPQQASFQVEDQQPAPISNNSGFMGPMSVGPIGYGASMMSGIQQYQPASSKYSVSYSHEPSVQSPPSSIYSAPNIQINPNQMSGIQDYKHIEAPPQMQGIEWDYHYDPVLYGPPPVTTFVSTGNKMQGIESYKPPALTYSNIQNAVSAARAVPSSSYGALIPASSDGFNVNDIESIKSKLKTLWDEGGPQKIVDWLNGDLSFSDQWLSQNRIDAMEQLIAVLGLPMFGKIGLKYDAANQTWKLNSSGTRAQKAFNDVKALGGAVKNPLLYYK